MTIRESYAKYTDPFGLVSGNPNPLESAGNAILFTAQKLWALHNRMLLNQDDVDQFTKSIYSECQVVPGLYRRNRFTNDQEGPDDLVGLASTSLFGTPYAELLLSYGERSFFKWGPFKFRYYYPNFPPYAAKPNARAWLGRQPQLIAHFQFAAGELPPLWRRIWWAVVIATTRLLRPDPYAEGGQDAWTLSWLLVKTYELASHRKAELRSFWCDYALPFWYRRYKKTWPGGINEVFEHYFADPNHPHVKWFVD